MKTIAILLAGGSGKRLGANIPKQFLEVAGKMIIEHTIEAFHKSDEIDEIAIVCHEEYTQFMQETLEKTHYPKVRKILKGGSERFHSSIAAIKAYDDGEEKKMLFHDAVRPLVSEKVISNCISKLDEYNAVGVGIKTTDTIWTVIDDAIVNIPDRRSIYRAQTPQGFRFSTIKKAYSIGLRDKAMITTDDCGVVMHYLPSEKISTVEGDDTNIKITRKEDLLLFENILKNR